jgi:hypothetical protein
MNQQTSEQTKEASFLSFDVSDDAIEAAAMSIYPTLGGCKTSAIVGCH